MGRQGKTVVLKSTAFGMEKFLWLLKKQLLGDITTAEHEELIHLTKDQEEYGFIYEEVCQLKSSSDIHSEDGLEAYERHRKRLRSLNLL